MSDTSNPANLASVEDFDARLKRTDEDRWLATRYAPQAARERLVAIYLLYQELQRALQTKEAMLGKIRIQWWRETLEQVGAKGPVRRHDLAEEIARVTRDRADLIAPLNDLVDCFDDVIDDHMHGGHTPGEAHEARHLAVEGGLLRAAGRALDAGASREALDALADAGEARLATVAELPDATARWASARAKVRRIPAQLWPALLHLAATRTGGTTPFPAWQALAHISRRPRAPTIGRRAREPLVNWPVTLFGAQRQIRAGRS